MLVQIVLSIVTLVFVVAAVWINGTMQSRYEQEIAKTRSRLKDSQWEIKVYQEMTGLIICHPAFLPETNTIHLHVIIASRGDTVVLSDDAYQFPSPRLITQLQLLR